MKALINFKYGGGMFLQGVNFEDCFLFETQYKESRGLIFYGEEYYGSIDMTNTPISTMLGMSSPALSNFFDFEVFFTQY